MVTSIRINNSTLELVEGDITLQAVDAIVNAANSALSGGGGVDGAIHRAGGIAIMAECRKIGRCPAGTAIITTAGQLPCKYVIHTVGPVYGGGNRGEAALLASSYRSSLTLAKEHGFKSVAFPSISTGVYSYPVEEAAAIALRTVVDFLKTEPSKIELLRFVLFSGADFKTYSTVLGRLNK